MFDVLKEKKNPINPIYGLSLLEWVLQVEKFRSFRDKLFGKNKMSATDSCFVFLKELIEKQTDFNDVHIA